RQKLPVLDRAELAPADGLHMGAYVLADTDGQPDVILIASGSEVCLALEARDALAREGISARVVSMPSWELFEAQTGEYRESVLPASITARLAIEPGVTLGWERYVGPRGDVIGLERFGASAPYEVVFENLGFTAGDIADRAKALVASGG
ncbi:MAG: transketolase, partial [Gemmatimonadetes bacterium]|nr:transketolase [Gemmatimonadota bacterium]